ncbi:hypothetical protein AX15_001386 [Amanita polypyramis BW_CC]|nr:hypothetical protein AX15_001386 [Amanita polypyramis BW_CC]
MGKAAGKSSLKSALQAQQSRLGRKQKELQAAQAVELKRQKQKGKVKGKGKGKGKSTTTNGVKRPTIPFRTTDKVLLVGEGNFSFTRALVRLYQDEASGGSGGSSASVFMPPTNITATAYDSEEDCYAKYPGAKEIVEEVKESGVQVLFGVDATKLGKVSALKGRRWDKVVWNFPHAGKGIPDQDRNILSNQLLILAFLRSAANVLATGPVPMVHKSKKKKNDDDDDDEEEGGGGEENDDMQQDKKDEDDVFPFSLPQFTSEMTRGTILITLRNATPYTLWDVPRLAKKPPLPTTASAPPNPKFIQLRSFTFIRSAWPAYEHRMTKGDRAHGTGTTGEGGEDRTWEFCLRDP